MKLTVFIPSAKSCERTATNTRSPVVVFEAERQADAEAVDEAVQREPRGAQGSDLRMSARLLGLVAMVEDESPLGEEEEEEAGADERADAVRVPDCLEGLGQDVEERDADHDAARERDQRRQLVPQPERDCAAEERRGDGQRGERNGDPGHWQSLHVP